jgi:nitroimidazol reductase NimA-like FMN-containing flavoprotein (pyridoxamine 5'-phosphate oxidase superfamily)
MFGELLDAEIREMLSKHFIGRIGCHAKGKTYVVPISYAFDGKSIYCHTQEGMKLTMMRENPMVCFEVDSMENKTIWKSIILWGKFAEISDITERNKGLKILLDRAFPFVLSKKMQLGAHWPFPPDDLNNIKGVVFTIEVLEMTGRFEEYDIGQAIIHG